MKLHHSKQLSILLFVSVLLTASTLFAQTKLLRLPDIYADTVVFCYGGDLWKAPATGGTAVRLTAHPGQELPGPCYPGSLPASDGDLHGSG